MAVLRIDHPDVRTFIAAKRTPGRWRHFNASVAVPDAFIQALQQGADWALVHEAEPSGAERHVTPGMFQRTDGLWVYASLPARALWDALMRAAFDVGEPGVLFIDRIRQDNNLRALETLDATNPCGEQPLPAYGACALGPLILPRFVRQPFGPGGAARLDFAALTRHARLQVRLLDNVLELTRWPLPQQAQEARLKRRVGVGFTGLGDALVMLGLRYDSEPGRAMAQRIARCLRDATYAASVDLARERGAFPLLNVDSYLAPGTFASRLPAALQAQIRRHGIRHSHLLSVAPAGSVSLAFADNCSSGIEPAFAWTCSRELRGREALASVYTVEDHAWRVYRALGGSLSPLPPAFVSATEVQPQDHLAMMQAVQPFVDASISKTVNLAPDVPCERFQDLYLQAWRAGLKGLAAYRPNVLRPGVLHAGSEASAVLTSGLPAPHFPGLAVSCGLSHAIHS
jgi:ribonucleoside-diphosphate reductase alpha chain